MLNALKFNLQNMHHAVTEHKDYISIEFKNRTVAFKVVGNVAHYAISKNGTPANPTKNVTEMLDQLAAISDITLQPVTQVNVVSQNTPKTNVEPTTLSQPTASTTPTECPEYLRYKEQSAAGKKAKAKAERKKKRQSSKYEAKLESNPPIRWVISTLQGEGCSIGQIGESTYEVSYRGSKVGVYTTEDPSVVCLRMHKNTSFELQDILRDVQVQIRAEYNDLASFGDSLDSREIVS